MSNTSEQLSQVAPFLRDSKADVRAQAAEILASQLSSAETRSTLKGSADVLAAIVKNSVRLTGDVQAVRGKVLTVLVLLSQESFAAEKLAEAKLVQRLMDLIDDTRDEERGANAAQARQTRELALMALSNFSLSEVGAGAMLGLHAGGMKEGRDVLQLLRWMLASPAKATKDSGDDASKSDSWKYVSHILANVTGATVKNGRMLLLSPQRWVPIGKGKAAAADSAFAAQEMWRELRSPSIVRRRGIARTVKNLCFQAGRHGTLLGSGIIPALIEPLARYSPEHALREHEGRGMRADIRDRLQGAYKPAAGELGPENDFPVCRLLLQSLVMLGTLRKGREAMRLAGVYPVVRAFHSAIGGEEVDDEIDAQIFTLVDYLNCPEGTTKGKSKGGDDDDDEVEVVEALLSGKEVGSAEGVAAAAAAAAGEGGGGGGGTEKLAARAIGKSSSTEEKAKREREQARLAEESTQKEEKKLSARELEAKKKEEEERRTKEQATEKDISALKALGKRAQSDGTSGADGMAFVADPLFGNDSDSDSDDNDDDYDGGAAASEGKSKGQGQGKTPVKKKTVVVHQAKPAKTKDTQKPKKTQSAEADALGVDVLSLVD